MGLGIFSYFFSFGVLSMAVPILCSLLIHLSIKSNCMLYLSCVPPNSTTDMLATPSEIENSKKAAPTLD